MKEELIHILDQSVCLTRRQMRDYLNGTMLPEEMHAAEVHLSSCPLCHMALEGFSAHTDESLAAISELNSGFLKDHFARTSPQIHLNSMAPAAAMTRHKRKGAAISFWQAGSVAAAVLLAFGIMWLLKHSSTERAAPTLAASQQTEARQPAAITPQVASPEPEQTEVTTTATAPIVAMNEPARKQIPAPLASEQPPVPEASTMDAEKKTEQQQATPANASGYMAYTQQMRNTVVDDKVTTGAPPPATDNQGTSISAGTVTAPSSATALTDQPGTTLAETQKVARASTATKQLMPAATAPRYKPAADEADSRSHMEQGDDLFEKGKYSNAVAHYREEMGQGSRNNRHQAAIMAARCYVNMGQKQRAIQLLQGILAEGGSQKRVAKKMLRDLEGAE